MASRTVNTKLLAAGAVAVASGVLAGTAEAWYYTGYAVNNTPHQAALPYHKLKSDHIGSETYTRFNYEACVREYVVALGHEDTAACRSYSSGNPIAHLNGANSDRAECYTNSFSYTSNGPYVKCGQSY